MSIQPVVAEKPRAEHAGTVIEPALLPCFEGLPKTVRDSFTVGQREALNAWARARAWTDHPVDLRLSLPTLFNRYYVVVLSGRERRGTVRRAAERDRHPVNTWANWFFIAGAIGIAFYFFALLVASLFTWNFLG